MNTCKIEKNNDSFKVYGVINFDTATHLCKQGLMMFAEFSKLQFDFAGVAHIDSSAMALLLSWIRHAKQQQKSLQFVNLPGQLLEIANLCEVMPILDEYILKTQPEEQNYG